MNFEAKNLGGLMLKNPFIMAPVKTAYGNLKGDVNELHLKFYEKVAKGGVSLIITEPVAVLKSGREHPKQLCIEEARCIEELKKITKTIHDNKSLACLNITHAGRAANPKASGQQPVAPSAIFCSATKQMPKQLTREDIEEIVDAFGKAAKNAKKAGFDAIELQAGMGYIIAQFLKDRTNKRTDEYGQDKTLFAKKVFASVFNNADGLEVIVRISGNEFVEDGITPADNIPILELAKQHNASAIHIGLGNACDTPPWYYNATFTQEEKQIETFKEIKKLTDLPIIVDGRMADVDKINMALNEGWADFIGLGKSLACDQAFVNKLINNKMDEIAYCGGCLQGCLLNVKSGVGLGCIINPFINKDEFTQSDKSLKFVVVGGGPAGMGVATYAKMKGYDVVLYEKEKLGGQFNLAIKPPFKDSMKRPLNSMIKALQKSQAKIIYEEATLEKIVANNPDVVVIATGAVSSVPKIDGIENENALDAFGFFENPQKITGKRALVLGVGLIGREIMETLTRNGFEEIVGVDILKKIPEDFTLARLKNMHNVKIILGARVEKFTENGVFVIIDDQKKNIGKFDTIITSIGTKSNNKLYKDIKDRFQNIEIIGDANKIADIYSATQQAYTVVEKY